MAKLTTRDREKIPAKKFAEPEKRAYPIEDKAHARNAKEQVRRSRRAGCRRPKNAKSTRRRTRF